MSRTWAVLVFLTFFLDTVSLKHFGVHTKVSIFSFCLGFALPCYPL